MSMEVNSSNSCEKNYLQRLQAELKETGKEENAEKKSESIPVPKDEYISDAKSGSKPNGLYRLGQDESGRPKILFDDLKKAAGKDDGPEIKQKNSADKAEECTSNTDKVDREIEKLKQEKKQLEQQIKAASDDEEKREKLEKKIERIEGELLQKDNDAYRRQNAVIS